MQRTNKKIIIAIVILLIVITAVFFSGKKILQEQIQPQTPSYIYLSVYDGASRSFIYKVDVANAKITDKKQITDKENFNASFLVKFNSYPNEIFLIGDESTP